MIDRFEGVHRYLSNFWPGDNTSLEHKYQAAKCSDPKEAAEILAARTPGKAKYLSHRCKIRPDWEEVRLGVMYDLVKEKFKDPDLARKLLSTGSEDLVEGNNWGDTFWGVCGGIGSNHLGQILMRVRTELQQENQLREYKD